MAPQKLSAKEAAIQLGTTPRTLRKFLRSKQSPIDPVGQGNRYEFDTSDLKKMKKSFVAWSNGSKPKPEKVSSDIPREIASIEAEEDLEVEDEVDLDDLEEPDEEDLLDIELELEEDEIE